MLLFSLALISAVMGHLAGARAASGSPWDGTCLGPAHPGDTELPLGLGSELLARVQSSFVSQCSLQPCSRPA